MTADYGMSELYPDSGMKNSSDFSSREDYVSYLRKTVALPDPIRSEDDTAWNYQLRWGSYAKARVEARRRLDELFPIKKEERPAIIKFRPQNPPIGGIFKLDHPQNIFGGGRT